ncbi:DUF4148 domain-containing protein [Paraburkholderia sp. JHI2823]|uniref:DUF4148 domain-containing protein n=1 Tax=Paraburkholderia sp. JHI2823 TaxID=3112960 RepID=UPI00316D1019
MKTIAFTITVALAFAAPLTTYSQSHEPPTHDQLRAELQQLEQAGYHPAGEDLTYPVRLQAAQARVANSGGKATNESGVDAQ